MDGRLHEQLLDLVVGQTVSATSAISAIGERLRRPSPGLVQMLPQAYWVTIVLPYGLTVARMTLTRTVAAAMWIIVVIAGPAGSAQAAVPDWSGLDATHYEGPVAPQGGTLISEVPLDPTLSVAGAGGAYRILYSTRDQHDQPAVSTAVVFTPKGPPPAGGWPTIAWAHGTVGLGDDCTPSALPRSTRDNEYLSHWLDQGYAIVGTDYVGLGTPGT